MEFMRSGTLEKVNGGRSLLFQCLLAFAVAFTLYMFYALMDGAADGPFSILMALITGVFFSIFSMFICFLIGLPIRLHRGLNRWWAKSYVLPVLIIMGGLFCIALSLAPAQMDLVTVPEDLNGAQKWIPDVQFAMIGWFSTIFGVMHTFLPTGLGRMHHSRLTTQSDN